MKKLLLFAFLFVVLIEYSAYRNFKYFDNYIEKNDRYHEKAPLLVKIHSKLVSYIMSGYFALPFSGRCSETDHFPSDWHGGSSYADYFQCDKLQRLINQE